MTTDVIVWHVFLKTVIILIYEEKFVEKGEPVWILDSQEKWL